MSAFWFVNQKFSRYVREMSSIGFAPLPEASEVDQLRSVYRSLHRLQTNLENLEACLKNGNVKQAEHHRALAKWNAEEAKKEIAAVGQSKAQ